VLDNGHLQVVHEIIIKHYQAPKHVAVPYIENTSYSTNKYSCVRPVHTLCIRYIVYIYIILQCNYTAHIDIIWYYHRFNYNKLRHSLVTAWTPHVTHTAKLSDQYEVSCPLYPLPTPYNQLMYFSYNSLISISCTTWRWPLSSAETCSCTLCRKHFMFYQ